MPPLTTTTPPLLSKHFPLLPHSPGKSKNSNPNKKQTDGFRCGESLGPFAADYHQIMQISASIIEQMTSVIRARDYTRPCPPAGGHDFYSRTPRSAGRPHISPPPAQPASSSAPNQFSPFRPTDPITHVNVCHACIGFFTLSFAAKIQHRDIKKI
jgi:hypothetical protein